MITLVKEVTLEWEMPLQAEGEESPVELYGSHLCGEINLEPLLRGSINLGPMLLGDIVINGCSDG